MANGLFIRYYTKRKEKFGKLEGNWMEGWKVGRLGAILPSFYSSIPPLLFHDFPNYFMRRV